MVDIRKVDTDVLYDKINKALYPSKISEPDYKKMVQEAEIAARIKKKFIGITGKDSP